MFLSAELERKTKVLHFDMQCKAINQFSPDGGYATEHVSAVWILIFTCTNHFEYIIFNYMIV